MPVRIADALDTKTSCRKHRDSDGEADDDCILNLLTWYLWSGDSGHVKCLEERARGPILQRFPARGRAGPEASLTLQ